MFFITMITLYVISLNILVNVHSLVELPAVDDNNIATTEMIIRNTVNKLFTTFRITDVRHKPRLKEFSTVHNFFTSITLKDCENLKEIARLTRINNFDNNSLHFIAQVDKALNEDDKNIDATDDVYVTTYIETFIKKLKHLKELYKFNSNYKSFKIDTELLNHLNHGDKTLLTNLTNKFDSSQDYLLTNEDYKKSNARRIYRGKKTRIKDFPFMASIQFYQQFTCGGSIIKNDLVITSSSCLQIAWNNRFFRENPSFLSVQVGSDYSEGSGESISVLEIYFHPRYNPRNLNNNLAIIRLSRRIRFSKKYKRVKSIDIDRSASPMYDFSRITVVGWGARDRSNEVHKPWNNKLSYAKLDFYPLRECQEVYSEEYVTMKNFCAGQFFEGGGACNGDVGGPGVVNGKLMGVISFGSSSCGDTDAPTVFTKIGYFSDWIEGIMDQDGLYYDYDYHISKMTNWWPSRQTKSTYTITPIWGKTTTEPIPILVDDILDYNIEYNTILQNVAQFKDFVSTIFRNEEIKNFVEELGADRPQVLTTEKPATKEPQIKPKPTKALSLITNILNLLFY